MYFQHLINVQKKTDVNTLDTVDDSGEIFDVKYVINKLHVRGFGHWL